MHDHLREYYKEPFSSSREKIQQDSLGLEAAGNIRLDGNDFKSISGQTECIAELSQTFRKVLHNICQPNEERHQEKPVMAMPEKLNELRTARTTGVIEAPEVHTFLKAQN
tara:strand:- start:919 stop:1248 length:330 start_codon:yes stop_codon:yes gene_type:complete